MNIHYHIRYSARPSGVAKRFLRDLSHKQQTVLFGGHCRIYHDPDFGMILIDAPTATAMHEAFTVLADKKLPIYDEAVSLLKVHPSSNEHRALIESFGFVKRNAFRNDKYWVYEAEPSEASTTIQNLNINGHIAYIEALMSVF